MEPALEPSVDLTEPPELITGPSGSKVSASMVVTVGVVGAAVKMVAWNSTPRGPSIMPMSISFQAGSKGSVLEPLFTM